MSHERMSIRHGIDSGIPFLLFFVGYSLHSIALGCALALATALGLAFLRYRRGEPRVAVLVVGCPLHSVRSLCESSVLM